MGQLYLKLLELMVGFVDCPELYCSIMTSHKSIGCLVEESYVKALLLILVRGRLCTLRAAFLHVPADQLIAIFESTERE